MGRFLAADYLGRKKFYSAIFGSSGPEFGHLAPVFLAGDSAYPFSTLLVKPYSVDEASRDDSKLLFNQSLSETENVYGVWKKRMACLN